MNVVKPGIPKGTRDFSPVEMAKRNYIFNTIRDVFQLYGFRQIETPAMENLSTLMGKYGEEGDKLLFKVLNSGDFLSKVAPSDLEERNTNKLAATICEKGLRYDLTVPFARYVVQHRQDLTLPFKRYQIQPVWRADRPQKGRYREFFQCDADVVGSDSLLNEVEFVQILGTVFHRFGVRVAIHFNNRKILSGIAEVIGQPDKVTEMTVAIDKLDKVGWDNVCEELKEDGFTEENTAKLQSILLRNDGTDAEKLAAFKELFAGNETGLKGVEECTFVKETLEATGFHKDGVEIVFNPNLARGLNYYTGCIFEVKALDVQIGSIAGGGRYDNLTGIFGMPGLSGVGISFGADRIYDVLNQLDKYPKDAVATTRVLFINFGEREMLYSLPIVNRLRENGVSVEMYPDKAKMKKQMAYANARSVPYVVIVGEDEMNAGKVALKDMESGEQTQLTPDELLARIG